MLSQLLISSLFEISVTVFAEEKQHWLTLSSRMLLFRYCSLANPSPSWSNYNRDEQPQIRTRTAAKFTRDYESTLKSQRIYFCKKKETEPFLRNENFGF